MTKNDGGQAFPGWDNDEGMTLRDYFAGQVIGGICASGPSKAFSNEYLVKDAYKIADAMLAEREKGNV